MDTLGITLSVLLIIGFVFGVVLLVLIGRFVVKGINKMRREQEAYDHRADDFTNN